MCKIGGRTKISQYTLDVESQIIRLYTPIKELSNCVKKSIIDGADKVESLLITDAMSSNVLSFSKESSRLKRLLIDGADFIANCKG